MLCWICSKLTVVNWCLFFNFKNIYFKVQYIKASTFVYNSEQAIWCHSFIFIFSSEHMQYNFQFLSPISVQYSIFIPSVDIRNLLQKPTNCLSVFDHFVVFLSVFGHFVGLALKGLRHHSSWKILVQSYQ